MAKYVNRDSLADSLVERFPNLNKQEAIEVVECVFDEIGDALADHGSADISGFGKFVIFDRKARMGINPVTKERMEILASNLPKFKPSKKLKIRCNVDRFK